MRSAGRAEPASAGRSRRSPGGCGAAAPAGRWWETASGAQLEADAEAEPKDMLRTSSSTAQRCLRKRPYGDGADGSQLDDCRRFSPGTAPGRDRHRPPAPVDQERAGDRGCRCGRRARPRRRAGSRGPGLSGVLPAGLWHLRGQRRSRRGGGSVASAQAAAAGRGWGTGSSRGCLAGGGMHAGRNGDVRRDPAGAGGRRLRVRHADAELHDDLAPDPDAGRGGGRGRVRAARARGRSRAPDQAVGVVRARGLVRGRVRGHRKASIRAGTYRRQTRHPPACAWRPTPLRSSV